MKYPHLGAVLASSAERFGTKPALLVREGKRFEPVSYRQLFEQAKSVASALDSEGIKVGDKVAVMSDNRVEWAYLDWGCQLAGIILVPIFPTLSTAQVRYILQNSEAKLLFFGDSHLAGRAQEAIAPLDPKPGLVCFDAVTNTRDFERFLSAGPGHPVSFAEPQPDDVCTLIYTSGTTGDPKGVMLTHRNIISNIEGCLEVLEVGEKDVFLWTLPLSHIFSRMAAHFLPVYCGATIGCSTSLRTFVEDIQLIRPTVMLIVPRFLEQFKARIEANANKAGPLRRSLFRWALAVGKRLPPRGSRLERPGFALRLQCLLADLLVGRRVKRVFGGRLRYMVSGAAALSEELSSFFNALGVIVLQGYGLTETSPVISVNPLHANRFGTVGPPIPGVEVKIAEDGEILTRGPHVMKGYYKLPEATREVISPDGWFATGDVGEIDEFGYLRITERKKDILVLANGKNVAPQAVEAALKKSPFIEEAVVFGDGQPVVTALIVPNFERLRSVVGDRPNEEIVNLAETLRLMRKEVDNACSDLADFEKVRRFALVPEPFSIAGGELTPTLKVRRKVVREKYGEQIASLLSD